MANRLRPPSSMMKAIRPWMIVGLVAAIYGGIILFTHALDPLAFATLGTRFSQHVPSGTEGYDGQFAYQIAVKPTGAAPFLDVPAYRYQRILYPLLARLLALGDAALGRWGKMGPDVAAVCYPDH